MSLEIYKTFGLCARCSFVDRGGLVWKVSTVMETADSQIILRVHCEKHGDTDTLYCADASFFKYVMSFSPAWKTNPRLAASAGGTGPVGDIEDVYSDPRLEPLRRPPTTGYLPVLGEISLGGPGLRDVSELLADARSLRQLAPRGRTMSLKLTARAIESIEEVNHAVVNFLDALSEEERNYSNGGNGNDNNGNSNNNGANSGFNHMDDVDVNVVLQLAVERWRDFVAIDSTAVLRKGVYPSVLMYVKRGGEHEAIKELEACVDAIGTIKGVHAMVQIMIDKPMPDLSGLLRSIRARKGLVRYVIFGSSRPPSEIMGLAQAAAEAAEVNKTAGIAASGGSVDPLEIIDALGEASAKDGALPVPIQRGDFVPVSAGMVLEPFLPMLGLGNFSIRPSPWCALAACLVTTEKFGESVPVTRIMDVAKLYSELKPIHERLVKDEEVARGEDKSASRLGMINGMRVKRALKASTRPGVKVPDLIAYLTDESKADICDTTLHNAQVFIVHNTMDLAALDMLRRCRCPILTNSKMTPSGFAASCTGCV